MLAYSSVAHAGYLLVGVAAGIRARAVGGAVLSGGLHVDDGRALRHRVRTWRGRGDRRSLVDDYRGPGLATSVAGRRPRHLPAVAGGFPADRRASWASSTCSRRPWKPERRAWRSTLVLSSLIAYYYYLRIVWKMYFDAVPEDGSRAGAGASRGFRITTADLRADPARLIAGRLGASETGRRRRGRCASDQRATAIASQTD